MMNMNMAIKKVNERTLKTKFLGCIYIYNRIREIGSKKKVFKRNGEKETEMNVGGHKG